MMIITLISWWYSAGWRWTVVRIGQRLAHINNVFAVKTLARTLFSPWKQDYTPKNVQNFFQVSIENGISRFIGAIVRTSVLFVALLWAAFVSVSGIITIVLWPLVPAGLVILPILTLMGVTV